MGNGESKKKTVEVINKIQAKHRTGQEHIQDDDKIQITTTQNGTIMVITKYGDNFKGSRRKA